MSKTPESYDCPGKGSNYLSTLQTDRLLVTRTLSVLVQFVSNSLETESHRSVEMCLFKLFYFLQLETVEIVRQLKYTQYNRKQMLYEVDILQDPAVGSGDFTYIQHCQVHIVSYITSKLSSHPVIPIVLSFLKIIIWYIILIIAIIIPLGIICVSITWG